MDVLGAELAYINYVLAHVNEQSSVGTSAAENFCSAKDCSILNRSV